MEKHPQITLDRVRTVLNRLKDAWWEDPRPLEIAVHHSAEPLPYAEAMVRDFAPVTVGYVWGPEWSTAWFRLHGDIPEAWAGAPVAARIHTGSEALIWDNGGPAQGLDRNRDDYRLADAAQPGPVELYVEAAGYLHFSYYPQADPRFTVSRAELVRVNRALWEFYHDLRVLYDLAQCLPADANRRADLIMALNAAVNRYRAGGEAGIPAARAILAVEFAKPADPAATLVNAIGHSHIDTAWLWPVRETIRKCSRTFATVLKYMETYPEYRYLQSQAQLYAFVKEHYPHLYTRIKEAVAAGRWEPQGSMWVEADCNIASGEALVRQILYGTKFFREEFGVESTVLWLPDVFGYSAAMPQILRGCGIDYFCTQKISWSQFNVFPHNTFYWEGIDGTRVLAHFLAGRADIGGNYGALMTPEEARRFDQHFLDKGRTHTWLYPYGYGDGGGGVTTEMLESYRRMGDVNGLPRLQQQFIGEWFPQMAAEAQDLRTWVGELYLEYHRGTYTTHAAVKQANRQSEWLLRDAEFLATIRPGDRTDYPRDTLERAWKLVLLNQFHDILPGSSIHWVYEDAAKDYAQVRTLGDGVIAESLQAFTDRFDTSDLTCPVMVWNTLSFTRSGLVSLPWPGEAPVTGLPPRGASTRTQLVEDGGERRLLVEVVDVPSMGYAVYDLQDGELSDNADTAITDEATATEWALENDLVRVELNALGEIVSFLDKALEREVIAPGERGNQLQLFDDFPIHHEAWDIDPFFDEVRRDVGQTATLTIVEAGPLRATIRVERQFTLQARLVQDIRLEANTRRVDFVTRIDWHETHALLKVAFPVHVYAPRATFDIQFGHLERPTHRNTSWDVARFEVPAHKWADVAEGDYGVALLNDSKYGYDVQGNVLRLSLLRAPKSPDPDADMGTHACTYSLLPHRGEVVNSGVPLAGYDVNVPLRAQFVPVQEGALSLTHSYFKLDKPNLIIEAVKRAEDGDGIIVRLYEAYRRRGTTKLAINGLCGRATRCDLLERDQHEIPVRGGVVEIPFRPFEIITLRLR